MAISSYLHETVDGLIQNTGLPSTSETVVASMEDAHRAAIDFYSNNLRDYDPTQLRRATAEVYIQTFEASLIDRMHRVYEGDADPDPGRSREDYAPHRIFPRQAQRSFETMRLMLEEFGYEVQFTDWRLDQDGRFAPHQISVSKAGTENRGQFAVPVSRAANEFLSALTQISGRRQGTLNNMIEVARNSVREQVLRKFSPLNLRDNPGKLEKLNRSDAMNSRLGSRATSSATQTEAMGIAKALVNLSTQRGQKVMNGVRDLYRTILQKLGSPILQKSDADLESSHELIEFIFRVNAGEITGLDGNVRKAAQNLADTLGINDDNLTSNAMQASDASDLTVPGFLRQFANYNTEEAAKRARDPKQKQQYGKLIDFISANFSKDSDGNNVFLQALLELEAQGETIPFLDAARIGISDLGQKGLNKNALDRKDSLTASRERYDAQPVNSRVLQDQGMTEVTDTPVSEAGRQQLSAYAREVQNVTDMQNRVVEIDRQMTEMQGQAATDADRQQMEELEAERERLAGEIQAAMQRITEVQNNNLLYDGDSYYFTTTDGKLTYIQNDNELVPLDQENIDEGAKGRPMVSIINETIERINERIEDARHKISKVEDADGPKILRIFRNRPYGEPRGVLASYSQKTGAIYMRRRQTAPMSKVFAHEFAHYAGDQMGVIDAIMEDGEAQSELIGTGTAMAGEDADLETVYHEAFTMFVWNYIRNPQETIRRFPNTYRIFEEQANSTETGRIVFDELDVLGRSYRGTRSQHDVRESFLQNAYNVTDEQVDQEGIPAKLQPEMMRELWNRTMRGIRNRYYKGIENVEKALLHPWAPTLRRFKKMMRELDAPVDDDVYGEIGGKYKEYLKEQYGDKFSIRDDITKMYQLWLATHSTVNNQVMGTGLQDAKGNLIIDPETNHPLTVEWLLQPLANETLSKLEKEQRALMAELIADRTKDLVARPIEKTVQVQYGDTKKDKTFRIEFGLDAHIVDADNTVEDGEAPPVKDDGLYVKSIELMNPEPSDRKAALLRQFPSIEASRGEDLRDRLQGVIIDIAIPNGIYLDGVREKVENGEIKSDEGFETEITRAFAEQVPDFVRVAEQNIYSSKGGKLVGESETEGKFDSGDVESLDIGAAYKKALERSVPVMQEKARNLTGAGNDGGAVFSDQDNDIDMWARSVVDWAERAEEAHSRALAAQEFTYQGRNYKAVLGEDRNGIPEVFLPQTTDGYDEGNRVAIDTELGKELRARFFDEMGGNQLFRIKEAMRRYRYFAEQNLRYAVDRGYMSEESFQFIKDRNEHYVAMNRNLEDIASEEAYSHASLGATGPQRKQQADEEAFSKALGSSKPVKDVHENLLNQTKRRIYEVERNALVANFIRAIDAAENAGLQKGELAVRVSNPSPNTVTIRRNGEREHWHITDPTLQRNLYTMGQAQNFGNSQPWKFIKGLLTWSSQIGRESIVLNPFFAARQIPRDAVRRIALSKSFMRDSEDETLTNRIIRSNPMFNPGFYKSYAGLQFATAGSNVEPGGRPLERFRNRQMQIYPDAAEYIKAQQQSGSSDIVKRVQNQIGNGIAQVWANLEGGYAESLAELKESGGDMFGYYARDPEQARTLIQDVMQQYAKQNDVVTTSKSFWQQFKRTAGKGYDKWTDILQQGENLSRVTEYADAKRKAQEVLGMEEQEARIYATYEARDLMDFLLRGTFMQNLSQVMMFQNATFQAFRRTLKGLKGGKTGPLWSTLFRYGTTTLLAQSVIKSMYDEDDWKDYLQFSNFERDFFWHIPIGDTGNYIRIPKDYDHAIFDAAFGRMVDNYIGGDDTGLRDYMESAATSGLPIDWNTIWGLNNPALTIAIQGVGMNYDYFSERPIVPGDEESVSLGLVKAKRDTETARKPWAADLDIWQQWLGFNTGVHPDLISFAASKQFGTIGRTTSDAINSAMDGNPATDWTLRWPETLLNVFSYSPSAYPQDLADYYRVMYGENDEAFRERLLSQLGADLYEVRKQFNGAETAMQALSSLHEQAKTWDELNQPEGQNLGDKFVEGQVDFKDLRDGVIDGTYSKRDVRNVMSTIAHVMKREIKGVSEKTSEAMQQVAPEVERAAEESRQQWHEKIRREGQ